MAANYSDHLLLRRPISELNFVLKLASMMVKDLSCSKACAAPSSLVPQRTLTSMRCPHTSLGKLEQPPNFRAFARRDGLQESLSHPARRLNLRTHSSQSWSTFARLMELRRLKSHAPSSKCLKI